MQSKIFQILQLLTPEELKSFGRWLQSPWCNSHKKLSDLLGLLQPHYPDFDTPKISKERLFKKLFPDKKYDAKRMRDLLSVLSIEVERFLQHQQLEQDSTLQKKLLLQAFEERHQTEWFQNLSWQMIERLEQQEGKAFSDLFLLSELYENLHRHPALLQRQMTNHPALQQADAYLDQCYALGKYRFLTELSERNKIVAEQNTLEQKIILLNQLSANLSLPALPLYRRFLHTSQADNKAEFLELKKYFLKQIDQVNQKDQSIFLLLLLNQAARLHLRGEPKVYEEIFALYQIGLDRNLLLHHQRMTSATFTNLVTIANLIGAFDFAQYFVEAYADRLSPKVSEDALTWGRVYTAYNAGRPTIKELEIALTQKRQDLSTFSIRSRILLLQMYFDAGVKDLDKDTAFFLDYSYAFEKQLQRNRNFPDKNKTAIKKTIQYTRKLFLWWNAVDMDWMALEKLKTSIASEHLLHAKIWLQQKIAELEKRKR